MNWVKNAYMKLDAALNMPLQCIQLDDYLMILHKTKVLFLSRLPMAVFKSLF